MLNSQDVEADDNFAQVLRDRAHLYVRWLSYHGIEDQIGKQPEGNVYDFSVIYVMCFDSRSLVTLKCW